MVIRPKVRSKLLLGLAVGGAIASSADAKPKPPEAPPTEGTVDGEPPVPRGFKVLKYRNGGGISPEPQLDAREIEAYLSHAFAKEKLDIQTNYRFEYAGVAMTLDGYDPVRNIGYEYFELGTEPDPAIRKAIAKLQKERKAAILFIELRTTAEISTLASRVAKFFKRVNRARPRVGLLLP